MVATVMSNLGLHHAMRDAGIRWSTTPVGDRYVLEALRGSDLSLGGEQSGHVVFADLGHHRRRPAHRAARCSAGWPAPAGRWRSWPVSCSGCRRC